MGTQGLVTIRKGGKVIAKLTAGDNGMLARKVAEGILVRLKGDGFTNLSLLLTVAEMVGFGCDACRVACVREGDGIRRLCSDGEDYVVHSSSEGDDARWFHTFDIPTFNPRWRHGTADHCVILDVGKGTIRNARHRGPKFEGGKG